MIYFSQLWSSGRGGEDEGGGVVCGGVGALSDAYGGPYLYILYIKYIFNLFLVFA